jgi:hypothetical protein
MRIRRATAALLLGAAAAAGLVACGSSRSASHTPIVETVTVTSSTSTSTAPQTTTTSPTTTSVPGSTTTPTRTSTGPASAGPTGTAGTGVDAAAARVRGTGFEPVSTATYNPSDTLRVLIGRDGSGAERAFFFEQDRYLGTDLSSSSGSISVAGSSDTEVVLRYGIYRTSDSLCCPSSSRTVRFELDNGALSPMDPVPSAALRR